VNQFQPVHSWEDRDGQLQRKRSSLNWRATATKRVAFLSVSQGASHPVSMEMKVDRSKSRKLFDRLIHFCCLDIKKAVACLLMGGSKKMLPDGMRLRGDINVLLLGDPGTAKSQLLKFVEKVAPISVYTSGKGSSAAGLTAVVQRDPVSVRTLPISPVDADLCFL
jgi:MCM P-loop domain